MKTLILLIAICLPLTLIARTKVKIKNLVGIKGMRKNQLIGFGLVVGLKGTGDSAKSRLTQEAMKNLIQNMGLNYPIKQILGKNAAAVIVTAHVDAFTAPGSTIDITVNSVGDAKSLAGGTLLQTALRGADKTTYAAAQGAIVLASEDRRGHTTSAVMTNGAIIEKDIPSAFNAAGTVVYYLRQADAAMAARIADAIQSGAPGVLVKKVTPGAVEISIKDQKRAMQILGAVGELAVDVHLKSKIVINEKTGTIVMGGDVRISPVVVSHRNIKLNIGGKTLPGATAELKATTTVQEVIDGLNALGVNTIDIISILQAIKKADALHSEIELM